MAIDSLLLSLGNFGIRQHIMQFDDFLNSRHFFDKQCMDFVRKKLTLITLGK